MLKKKLLTLYQKILELIFGKTILIAFEEFIEYKKYQNISTRTVEYYKDNFLYFTRFCTQNTRCRKINENIIIKYADYMRKILKVNDVTINTRIRACRAFMYFAMKKKYIKNFSINLIKEKNKTEKVPYTDSEIKRLLVMPKLDKNPKLNFTNFRNWVITNYVLSTGNRLNTIKNILIKDVDIENKVIFLRALKSGETQKLPISDLLAIILKHYIAYRKNLPGTFLFCTFTGTQLASRSLETAIATYNNSRNVQKTSLHLYRHKFAELFCRANGNVFKLQILLNHKTLEMTRHYVRLYASDLREDINKLNPLEVINKTT